MISNISDAIYYIEHLKRFKNKENLDLFKKILKEMNNPDLGYFKIHVGGTNGKGSTVNYIKTVLTLNNLKVGSFTSPYIMEFNERIMINSKPIPNEKLLYYINYIKDFLDENNYYLTFFEFITLLAFKYFKDEMVDIAIIEVGIGGLLDATNSSNYDISLITNVGYDHQKQLGSTLEEIAYNKVGIIKNNKNYLITSEQNMKKVFDTVINNYQAKVKYIDLNNIKILNYNPLIYTYKEKKYELSMLGTYQTLNAALATECLEELNIDYKTIYEGLKMSYWPGRLEHYKENIYLDGAHNVSGIIELINNIKILFPNKKIDFIFGAMKDKAYNEEIKLLSEIANRIIFTKIDYPRAKHSFELYNETDFNNKFWTNDLIEALKLVEKNNITFIIGSLYLVSEAKKIK